MSYFFLPLKPGSEYNIWLGLILLEQNISTLFKKKFELKYFVFMIFEDFCIQYYKFSYIILNSVAEKPGI